MRCKRKNKSKNKSLILFSFTAGLIFASFLPFKVLIIILSIALILLGLSYLKCP